MDLFSELRSVGLPLAWLLCVGCSQHGLRRVDAAADASNGRDTAAPADASADTITGRDSVAPADSPSDRVPGQPADASPFPCVPGPISSDGEHVPIAGAASAVVVADLNGDGTADLAAIIESQDVVVIVPGCGGGTFGQAVRLATGRWPTSLAVVDVNADGKMDLAVSNWNDKTISILTGLGGGAFSPKIDYPVGGQPRALVAGDFHGDGHPDLAIELGPGTKTDVLTIMRNRGDGTYFPLADYELGLGRYSLATGDLDGDGRDELAVTDWGSRPVTIFSWGSGGDVTSRSIGEVANSVAIGDLNGDGHRDLAWSTGRGVQVTLNRGDGSFAPAADYQAGPVSVCVSWALTMGDVNGDGRSDLLVLNDDCQVVTAITNRGDGTFAEPLVYLLEDYLMFVAAGDLNADGRADLIVSLDSESLTILLAQPDGRFARPIVP